MTSVRTVIRFAFVLATVVLSLVVLAVYTTAFRNELAVYLGLASLLVGAWLATLIHEVGHAAAAISRGWQVVVFVVRPFALQVPNRNLTTVWEGLNPGAGGWVLSVPGSAELGTRLNYATIVAAGPSASLIVGTAIFAVAAILAATGGDIDLRSLGFGFGLQNVQIGVFSLLPQWRGSIRSDGDILRHLWRRDDNWSASQILAWLGGLLSSRVRLRSVPTWLLDCARTSDRSEAVAHYLDAIEIGILLDAVEVDAVRVRHRIDIYRQRFGASEWLQSCDAYLAAVWEDDLGRARDALWQGELSDELRPLTLAAIAAVAARSGDLSGARSRLVEMRAASASLTPFRDMTLADMQRQIEAIRP